VEIIWSRQRLRPRAPLDIACSIGCIVVSIVLASMESSDITYTLVVPVLLCFVNLAALLLCVPSLRHAVRRDLSLLQSFGDC